MLVVWVLVCINMAVAGDRGAAASAKVALARGTVGMGHSQVYSAVMGTERSED